MAIEMNIHSADDIFRTVTLDNAAWSSIEHADSEILLAPRTEEDDLEEKEEEDELDDEDEIDDEEDEGDEEEDDEEEDDEEDHGLITRPQRSRPL